MLEVSFTGFGKSWYVYISGVHVHKQNIIECGDNKVTGIFRLSEKDEDEYLRTNNFYHVKKMKPLPSPGSTFSQLLEEGRILKIDAEYCIFEVMQSRKLKNPIRGNVEIDPGNIFEPIRPDDQPNQTITNETDSPGEESLLFQNRVKRLSAFIKWLGIQAKSHKIKGFNPQKLDCTKDQLFKHLSDWEKKNITEDNWVFANVLGWSSCGVFWRSKSRQCICNTDSDSRKGRHKTASAYNFLFSE